MKRVLAGVFVTAAVVAGAVTYSVTGSAPVDPLEARAAAFMDAYNSQDAEKACSMIDARYWSSYWLPPGACAGIFAPDPEVPFTPLSYEVVSVLRIDGDSAVVIVSTDGEYGKALLTLRFELSKGQPSGSYRSGSGLESMSLKPGVSGELPYARWQVVATGSL